MASTVSRNLIEILIRARDEASKDIKKSGDNVAVFEKQMLRASAATAAAGAAMLAAVTASAIAGGRFADSLDDLSKRTLVSTSTLAALGTQLVKGGGQFDDAEVSVRTFDRAVIDAISGQKEAQAQFERLGISVADLVGPGGEIRGFEELLPRVADGFSGLRDEAAKVDSAVALFGRSATSLVPVLSQGSAGLRDAQEEAKRLNVILGGDLQANAARLGDRLDDLKLSVVGMNNSLAGALEPTLGRVITAMADAAKAVGAFAQAHPTATRNIIATSGAITALAATLPIIGALSKAFKASQLQAIGSATANAVFQKSLGPLFVQARNAAGQFGVLRATTAGWVAGLGIAAAAVAALTVAIASLVAMQQEAAARAQKDDADARRFQATLDAGTASALEQAKALEQLRDIRGRQAVRETRASLPTLGQRERVVFEEQSRARALADFDRENAAFAQELKERAARESLGIPAPKITVDVPTLDVRFKGPLIADVPVPTGPEISKAYQDAFDGTNPPPVVVPSPPVKLAPIDESDFGAQIARQREIVQRAQAELTRATQFRRTADRQSDVTIRLTARTGEEEATNKLAQAEQRLFELQRQAADKTRDIARAAIEARQALLDMDAAAGRITLGQVIEKNRQELDASVVAVNRAKAAFDAATPGTKGYTQAVEAVSAATDRWRDAQQRLESSLAAQGDQLTTDRESIKLQADALRELAAAEDDLATAQSTKKTDAAQFAIETRNVERLRAAMVEARAAASFQAGPVPVERLQEAATATRTYADATLQLKQQQEQLGATFDASGVAISTFGDLANSAIGAIGGAAVNAAQIAKQALSSIIRELIHLISVARAAKLATAAIGAFNPLSFVPLPFGIGRQSGGEVIRGTRGLDNVNVRVGRGESIFDHHLTDDMRAMVAAFKNGSLNARANRIETSRTGGSAVEVHNHFHGVLSGSSSDVNAIARKQYETTKDYVDTRIAQPRFA